MTRTEHPLISLRLYEHHKKPELLEELLAVLSQHRASTDEIWFATEYGFPAIETHLESARMMAIAARRVRKAGYAVGLQIINTLGHGDVQTASVQGITWQRMVGSEGQVAPRCNCPRAPGLHDYLRVTTRAYCAWKPEVVWIDDDLRMHHHSPVDLGCFCDRCIDAFSRRQGRSWDRGTLVEALDHPTDAAVRREWVRFNQESLALVAAVVSETVHAAAPDCAMGLQQSSPEWGLYTGPTLKPVFEAMARATGHPLGSRPGGGFYDDHAPRVMLLKAYNLARQISRLPENVTVVRAEIENFMHTAMGKSAHGTVVESALDLAMGCTGLSYATLMLEHEPPSWHAGTMSRIVAWRPFFERYLRDSAGSRLGGLEVVYGLDHAGRRLRPGEKPLAWATTSFGNVYMFSTFGMPLCMEREFSTAAILTPEASDGLGEAELRDLFSRGVFTDGETVLRLKERGLDGLVGLGAERLDRLDAVEEFTSDPLNGPHAGHRWQQVSFGALQPVYRLDARSSGARVLGRYVTFAGEVRGDATVVTETALGGRVAVAGYHAWQHVVSSARRAQLLSMADWVSSGRLPAMIDTAAQVAAVPRTGRDGSLRSLLLLNVSIDASPPLSIRLRSAGNARAALWVQPTQTDQSLSVTRTGTELQLSVPPIPPWSVGYVVPVA